MMTGGVTMSRQSLASHHMSFLWLTPSSAPIGHPSDAVSRWSAAFGSEPRRPTSRCLARRPYSALLSRVSLSQPEISYLDRIRKMPVLLVYSYLWNTNRFGRRPPYHLFSATHNDDFSGSHCPFFVLGRWQLFSSIFFNYFFPLLLEALP